MMVPCSAHRMALYTGDVADRYIARVLYGAGANLDGAQKSAVMFFGLRAGGAQRSALSPRDHQVI